jgi:hypothetical protein
LRVNVASVTYFPPTEREGSTAGRGEWGCVDKLEGGRKLEVEDVASGTEEAKAA